MQEDENGTLIESELAAGDCVGRTIPHYSFIMAPFHATDAEPVSK